MFHSNPLSKLIFLTSCLISLLYSFPSIAQKIAVDPSMVYDEYGFDFMAAALVDEQNISGDPMNGGGTPANSWFPGWNDVYYPASVVIDLKQEYRLTDVYLYAGNESADIELYYGEPLDWQFLTTTGLENENSWNQVDANVTTRFVKVSLNTKYSKLFEIVLYGSPAGNIDEEPDPQWQAQPTFDQFIGVNGFNNNPIDKLMAVGFVREYHLWLWNEGNEDRSYEGFPNNKNKFSPDYPGFGSFDRFYEDCFGSDIQAVPCMQGSVNWVNNGGEDKPLWKNGSALDPESYIAHADHLFQVVARYGHSRVDDNKLKLADDQQRLSGMGLINYIENWNEPDKWWSGKNAIFNPYEFAAMCSADYDGHLGRMGNTVGVKNADPNCKLVMGGITKISLDYIKSMKYWADVNRNGSFPADVLNFHHYSTNAGGQYDDATVGVSPEQDNLKGRIKPVVDYRNRYLPGKEVWLSEFGYDTHPESIYRAPQIGPFSQFEVQAQWLLRSLFELSAAGVDRTMIYRLLDDRFDPIKFATMGIVGQGPDFIPKTSWYYLYTAKNILTGKRFYREEILQDDVRVYSYKDKDSDEGAYAIWSPTSNAEYIDNYELNVGEATSATLVQLVDKSIEGERTSLEIKNGKVQIEVSERPSFILVNKIPADPLATMDNILENKIRIFPTITDKELFVKVQDVEVSKDLSIQIVDSKGIIKMSQKWTSQEGLLPLNIAHLPQGIYYIQIGNNKGTYTQKIVRN